MYPCSASCRFHDLDQFVDVGLAFDPAQGHFPGKFIVGLRIQIGEGKVFEFRLDLGDPQPVGKRGIDIQGFLRDPFLFIGRERLERAHVMQPVGEFDQDDPDVLCHGDDHLAEVVGLALLAALQFHAATAWSCRRPACRPRRRTPS